MNTVRSAATLDILKRNGAYIPGGVSSTNRVIDPPIVFARGSGAFIWDIDGNKYLDFHAAFAPHFLGHNFAPVNEAVMAAIRAGNSLFGAGPSELEGRVAELICTHVPAVDKVMLLNTGSEATSLAIRLARAVTGRQHFIVMQGGYNGNHDELACNVFNSLDDIGPRVSPGEYPLRPVGAGGMLEYSRVAHVINFNDLDSVRYVCRRYPIAALITEPILQNIGVVRPQPGYLDGLRALADELGFLLVFDEVKTGFRHALGGYSALANVTPDLVTYGKAVANGYPMALVGGKARYMDYIVHPDVNKRPFVAGTYNGHPMAVAAAIRTIEYLVENGAAVYGAVEAMGRQAEAGILDIFARRGMAACVARQGSAFSYYLMESPPRDFHDLIAHHDFETDVNIRRGLVERGIFFGPIATKQCSISYAHRPEQIDAMLEEMEAVVAGLAASRSKVS
jgi:glutamate-1-semialdehyde 2,1-aminomutase